MGTFVDNNAKFLYSELVRRYGKRAKMEVRTVHRWRRQPLSVQDLQDIKTKLKNIGAGQLSPRNDLRKWQNILKREFKIFDGSPPAFMVSIMTSKPNQKRIKGEVLRIYGDDGYFDMVDLKNMSIREFLEGDQLMPLMEMDNIVVVIRKKR